MQCLSGPFHLKKNLLLQADQILPYPCDSKLQLLSIAVMSDSMMSWTAAHQAPLCSTIPWSLLSFMSIELVMLSNQFILCCPCLLCLQSFPASVSFPMTQVFTSSCQSIGGSASPSVLPRNIQGWFPLGLTGWSCSPRNSQESSQTPQFKSINSSAISLLYGPTLTWLLEKL